MQADLSNKLKTLSDHLLARNNKTGEYYFSLTQKLTNTPSNEDLIHIANEILGSGRKIQDLAGFDYTEDIMLEDILLITQKIVEKR